MLAAIQYFIEFSKQKFRGYKLASQLYKLISVANLVDFCITICVAYNIWSI